LSIYGPGTTCAQITAGTATSVVCQNPGATTDYNYTFTATANQCYLIVLDGYAGTACTYDIQVSATLLCATPPSAPTVNVTQPTCAVSTGTIVVTSPIGAGLQYSINDVVYQSSTTFSGLAPGTYNVTVRDASNCVSTATIVVINPPAGAPAVPTITTTAPTCLANGFSQISNYVGGTTYTFTPAGPTVDGTGMITGMTLGTSYTVTATVGSCTSASSASFTNLAQLTVPTVPTVSVTAPTCSANGFATITNYLAGLTYVFTPVGPTVDGTGLISGMTIGTNYTVSASNGSCASSDSSSFTIAAMLNTPAIATASVTVQPTCPNPSGTIVVTAPLGGSLEYSIDNGVTYQTSPTFSGLAPDSSYTIIVRNTSSGCTSSASPNIIINSVPPSPVVSTVSGCNGARFEVTASVDSGIATYEWYDSSSNLLGTTATVVVSQSGTYEVRATVDSCTTIEFITIQVLPCTIPKGISPNNDGDNDVWDLSGLNVQKAQIFNRYGVEVYSRSNYTNEWDGRTNSGDELPTATYYYVLSLPNGEVKTGWVYINRQQ
jgi:gliding motility-associated-like protein